MATLAEEMAIAVLRGDMVAARALADLVCEQANDSAVALPPVKQIKCSLDRLRVVLFIDDKAGELVYDAESLRESIREWLWGSAGDALVLNNISRIELYELPEQEDITHTDLDQALHDLNLQLGEMPPLRMTFTPVQSPDLDRWEAFGRKMAADVERQILEPDPTPTSNAFLDEISD